MTPQRIQLSRKSGFNLQNESRKRNGLPCVVVSRPSKWGNPFLVTQERSQEQAVQAFVGWLTIEGMTARIPERKQWILEHLYELRGKNLGCWCKIGTPCHGDVLLAIANT